MFKNLISKLSLICRRLFLSVKRGGKHIRETTRRPLFKARVGAAFAAFVLAASIFAWGTIDNGIAWFEANEKVDAFGMVTRMEGAANVTASLRSYGIVNISGQRYTVRTSSEKYALPQHDPNEISYSEYKLALLIEIEMWADMETPIELLVSTEKTGYTMAKSNFLSNCVKISTATFDSATNVAAKGSRTQAFTSVSGGQCKKVSEFVLHTGTLTAEKQTVYFLLEYNRDFLDFINEYILNNRADDPVVNYSNDLIFTIRSQG